LSQGKSLAGIEWVGGTVYIRPQPTGKQSSSLTGGMATPFVVGTEGYFDNIKSY